VTKPVHFQHLRDSIHLAMGTAGVCETSIPSPTSLPNLDSSESEHALRHDSRILLVEDNEVNQRVVIRMLSQLQLQVDIANNGQEALTAFQQQTYDLIFMDCQMPEMDGFEATHRIRLVETQRENVKSELGGEKTFVLPDPSLPPPLPSRVHIIALTANALSGDRERCLEAGMDDFLSKPVSLLNWKP